MAYTSQKEIERQKALDTRRKGGNRGPTYTSLKEIERQKALSQQLRNPNRKYARNPLGAIAAGLNAYTANRKGEQVADWEETNRGIEQEELNNIIKRISPDYEKNRLRGMVDALRNAPKDQLIIPGETKTPNYQSPLAQHTWIKQQMDEAKANRVRTPEQQKQEIELRSASRNNSAPGNPYYVAVYTNEGMGIMDTRTGNITFPLGKGGDPLVRTTDDPETQGSIEKAKLKAKTDEAARLAAPENIKGYNNILENITWLNSHKNNMNAYYGAMQGLTPTFLPGTTNAKAKIEQIVAYLSIENREKMEGSGAISDFEARMLGKAATILGNDRISDKLAADELLKVERILTQAKIKAESLLTPEERAEIEAQLKLSEENMTPKASEQNLPKSNLSNLSDDELFD